ncbi:MAG: UvrD-helicase domain-containing protein [Microbacteriaceae bacterium]
MTNTSPLDIAVAIATAKAREKARLSGTEHVEPVVYPPTAEQTAIIQSPVAEVALVVAGAGSGKTETMANRVLWLLANNHVEPHQILGLTFTRKAASELSERINERIQQMAESDVIPAEIDEFSRPTVSTYNSFASSIFRDHAARIGWDSDAQILTEASAWTVAYDVVAEARIDGLDTIDYGFTTIVDAVLKLARDMREHGTRPEQILAIADQIEQYATMPIDKSEYAAEFAMLQRVAPLRLLLRLAQAYQERKRRRGLIEFADQVALAAQIVREHPAVAAHYRSHYRIVLLDEYQDTSVGQTELLAALFPGGGVMAVGDPNQAIYGFRGASATNLATFHASFGEGSDYELSTSWRNGLAILDIANTIIAPHDAGGVGTLTAAPAATNFPVESLYAESDRAEAAEIAQWMKTRIAHGNPNGDTPSAAVLVRVNAAQSLICDALRDAGVPYHVLGLGGLLEEPAIADLVCGLAVVADPLAGAQLVRLLAGARWRIGPADLAALRTIAHNLSTMYLSADVSAAFRESVANDEAASIVDGLDYLNSASWEDLTRGERPFTKSWNDDTPVALSEEGFTRLKDAAALFRRLRSHSDLPVTDMIDQVIRELRIEVEAMANPHRDPAPALESFMELVHSYRVVAEHPSLMGFLRWLREVENREKVSPRSDPPEPGTVQVLTMHSSKGLEWDIVAVPRLVDGTMPNQGKDTSSGWLKLGALPYPLRGDSADLPRLDFGLCEIRKDVRDVIVGFKKANTDRQRREEDRLMYVAVTRARHRLLLSGSWWKNDNVKPTEPSAYLRDMSATGLIGELPVGPVNEHNPNGDEVPTILWPADPLGSARRRESIVRAAEFVHNASSDAGGYTDAVDRVRSEAVVHDASLAPRVRVPASQYAELLESVTLETDSLETQTVTRAAVRPVPTRPYAAARLGTQFHTWVEHFRDYDAEFAALDSDSDVDAEALTVAQLQQFQANFAQSRWASLTPTHTEIEILHPVNGRIIVCKIDAVFTHGDRIEIVDWKTGKEPRNAADRAKKAVQLALYRRAYSEWSGTPISQIDATLYFVATDNVIELSPDELDEIPEFAETPQS